MTIIKRSDIVPILYFGGTGGHFLGSFLYAAQGHIFDWKFSEHGNAHACQKNSSTFFEGIGRPAIDHITALTKIKITDEIKYIPSHCSDPSLALLHFDKIIKTCFAMESAEEITLAFIAKWGFDSTSRSINELVHNYDYTIKATQEFTALINPYSVSDSVLNISWLEMLHLDPTELITKLSVFADIPYAHFPICQLLMWRELTKSSIAKARHLFINGISGLSR